MGITKNSLYTSAETICASLTVLVAGIVRLGHLDRIPAFIDESGGIGLSTNYAMLSLPRRIATGRVFGYIFSYPTARFAADPLYATRFVTALMGILTVIGLYIAVRRLAGRLAALLAAMVWALLPYATFHDRLALHDPIVVVFLVWSMAALLEANGRRSAVWAVFGGLFLGLATITKITAILSGIWVFFIVATAIDFGAMRTYAKRALFFAAGFCLPAAILIPGALQFFPEARQFLPSSAVEVSRCHLFMANLGTAYNWVAAYNSRIFCFCSLLSAVIAIWRPSRLKTALLASFILCLASFALLFQIWFPRYFLAPQIPLVMLVAVTTAECFHRARESAHRRRVGALSVAVLMGLPLTASAAGWARENWLFQVNPSAANLPAEDRFQYLEGWPSGAGVREAASYLDGASKQGSVVVYVSNAINSHGYWDLPLYLRKSKVYIERASMQSRTDCWRAIVESARSRTFVLMEPPMHEWPAELTAVWDAPFPLAFEYKRPRARGAIQLYEIDRSRYLLPAALQPLVRAESASAVIADIANPNGVEKRDGQPFYWLGLDPLTIQIAAGRAGTVVIETAVYPGPSLVGTGIRRLWIKTSGGFAREIVSTGGKTRFQIPVHAGSTEVVIAALDRPNVAKIPNNDPRQLIVGLKGVEIVAFGLPGSEVGARGAGLNEDYSCTAHFEDGWYAREVYGSDWLRWNNGHGRLVISTPQNMKAEMSGSVYSMLRPNLINVYFHGEKTATWHVDAQTQDFVPFARVPLDLRVGDNVVELVSGKAGMDVPNDNRKLAVAVKNLSIRVASTSKVCAMLP